MFYLNKRFQKRVTHLKIKFHQFPSITEMNFNLPMKPCLRSIEFIYTIQNSKSWLNLKKYTQLKIHLKKMLLIDSAVAEFFCLPL